MIAQALTQSLDLVREEIARAIAPRRPGTSSTPGCDQLLAYQAMVGNGIVAMKDHTGDLTGPLLAGYRYRGPDCESRSHAELAELTRGFNAVWRRLDFGTMLQFDAIVRRENSYIRGDFDEAVDHVINEERRRHASHFVTDHYFFITQTPSGFDRPDRKGLRRVLLGESPEEVLDDLQQRLDKYERFLAPLADSLGRLLELKRLVHTPDNDELLQALQLCVNGRLKRCRLTADPDKLAELLARDLAWSPDKMRHGEDYVAVVGLLGYPLHSEPGILSILTKLGIDLRWSTRFLVLDYRLARSKLADIRRSWVQKIVPFMSKVTGVASTVDRDAMERASEVEEALSDIESQAVRYGHFTSVIVLRGSTQSEANDKARLVTKALEDLGFEARLETYNKLEALLGSFPGHGCQNVRGPLMHSLHLAHLMPFAREWIGEATNPNPFLPRQSPPLMQATTCSGGRFNLNIDQGDLGHTAIFGPPGTGKSTLLACMASQFMKYTNSRGPAQVFVLEQGASMMALTMARQHGAFYPLGGEGGPAICPLAEIDDDADRAWAAEWLELLCEQHGLNLNPAQRGQLYRAVVELSEFTPHAAERTLVHLLPHLVGSGLEQVLSYYTSGVGARILNGASTDLTFANFTTFELEELFGYGPRVVIPALEYIFRQIEKRLNGRPSLVIIDEAWLALSHPRLIEKLRARFKTWRKKNCRLVLATQSLSDVVDSPIADTVFESCPTKILLPNHEASDSMRRLYAEKLRLSEAQIQLITEVEKKCWYLYFARGRSRLFTLNLGPVARSFVGAGSAEELATIQELAAEHGDAWPYHWLRHRGLANAAEDFVRHRRAYATQPRNESILQPKDR